MVENEKDRTVLLKRKRNFNPLNRGKESGKVPRCSKGTFRKLRKGTTPYLDKLANYLSRSNAKTLFLSGLNTQQVLVEAKLEETDIEVEEKRYDEGDYSEYRRTPITFGDYFEAVGFKL